MRIFDIKLKKNVLRYIFQCALATITLLIVLLYLNVFHQATIIASLGASTFIIFALPESLTAQKRNFLGGYLTGIIVGI